jgi:hypothetical protein
MPLAVDGDGIVEPRAGADLRKKPRSQNLCKEPFAGRADRRFLGRRRFVASSATDIRPDTPRHRFPRELLPLFYLSILVGRRRPARHADWYAI